jgi:O-antigen/teichoic acid export membrane protein
MSLKRNSIWNLLGGGAPFLLGVVTIPYLVRQLGVEAFGILTLVWALIGYFSLFDFGLGRALTQQVATSLGTGKLDQVSSIVKYGLLLTVATGLVGGLLLGVAATPLGTKWLNVSESLQKETVSSLLIASLGIPLTTLTAGLRGVLEAHEDFTAVNLLRILLGIANFGLPALGIMVFGPSLLLAVTSLIVARVIVVVAHMYLVYLKMRTTWLVAKFDKNNIRSLLSFGAWMTLSNVISPLMVTADRFIISSALGAGLIAYYTVPFDSLLRLLIIPSAITTALFPRFASVIATDREAAKKLYQKCKKAVGLIMTPVSLTVMIGSYWAIKLWLGQDFATHSWFIASILSVGLLFNSLAQIPHAVIQAGGDARTTALIHLGEFTLYLPLLFVFIKYFGLSGAAIIWVVRVSVDYFILSFFVKNRCYKLWSL